MPSTLERYVLDSLPVLERYDDSGCSASSIDDLVSDAGNSTPKSLSSAILGANILISLIKPHEEESRYFRLYTHFRSDSMLALFFSA